MKPAAMMKALNTIPPAAINDNTSPTATEIDTIGFRSALVIVSLGATDIALTALKIQQSDTSGSGHADVTGLVFGATGYAALPGATADNNLYAFRIDLRGKKRYLKLVVTFGDGTVGGFGSAVTLLFEGEDVPASASARGFTAELTA